MHRELQNLRLLLKAADPPFYAYLGTGPGNRAGARDSHPCCACTESKDCLNMFFCFRWLLVLFKREFSFDAVQRLWEVWPFCGAGGPALCVA
jgi:TBC1 domain family member 15